MPRPEAVRLAEGRRWDELIGLVRGPEGRDRAMERDEYGQLALHEAVFYRAPVEVVRALLDAFPQGAQATCGGGHLALHFALDRGAPMEVVRALLDAYPQGAQVADSDGCLALHFAASNGVPVEVVRALLDAYPEGAQATDSDRRLAFHWAAEAGASVEVVCALLDAYPQGAQATDIDGELALHMAAEADNYSPKNHAVLALAHAGHPPSRRWTPETCAALRRVAADINRPELRALIDAHLSRVRTLLLVSRRHGLPSELLPLLVGPVYAHDIFR